MVDEITPTYYAEGAQLTYTLTGHGFDVLPDNAIGIRSSTNSNPFQHLSTGTYRQTYHISERSDTRIVLTTRNPDDFTSVGYLGCIVTEDRNFVFWANESQPLPANRGGIVEPEFIDER